MNTVIVILGGTNQQKIYMLLHALGQLIYKMRTSCTNTKISWDLRSMISCIPHLIRHILQIVIMEERRGRPHIRKKVFCKLLRSKWALSLIICTSLWNEGIWLQLFSKTKLKPKENPIMFKKDLPRFLHCVKWQKVKWNLRGRNSHAGHLPLTSEKRDGIFRMMMNKPSRSLIW